MVNHKRSTSTPTGPKASSPKPNKPSYVEVEGVVREALPNTLFRIAVTVSEDKEVIIMANISGKMRKNYIKILPGDRVKLEVVPSDPTKGRITYRYR